MALRQNLYIAIQADAVGEWERAMLMKVAADAGHFGHKSRRGNFLGADMNAAWDTTVFLQVIQHIGCGIAKRGPGDLKLLSRRRGEKRPAPTLRVLGGDTESFFL